MDPYTGADRFSWRLRIASRDASAGSISASTSAATHELLSPGQQRLRQSDIPTPKQIRRVAQPLFDRLPPRSGVDSTTALLKYVESIVPDANLDAVLLFKQPGQSLENAYCSHGVRAAIEELFRSDAYASYRQRHRGAHADDDSFILVLADPYQRALFRMGCREIVIYDSTSAFCDLDLKLATPVVKVGGLYWRSSFFLVSKVTGLVHAVSIKCRSPDIYNRGMCSITERVRPSYVYCRFASRRSWLHQAWRAFQTS